MKLIIFAGGSGTRLWPLSRESLPKQFKKLFNGKSTIQLAVERIEKTFGVENIIIGVNEQHVALVKQQLPQIPTTNIVAEPTKRDVAPAIGYNMIRLKKLGYTGPIAILWADHLMDNTKSFLSALKKGQNLIKKEPNRFVFLGENPRYAENNLGWIHYGKELEKHVHEFKGWIYKPQIEKCKEIFDSGEWAWNPGYFITDIDFLLGLYREFAKGMYDKLEQIAKDVGTLKEVKTLKELYPQLESVSFDNKILEKLKPNQAVVIRTNMKWSDPGTLYALKEALVKKKEDNLKQGLTYELNTQDSLLINEEKDKILAVVGLKEIIVVNTKDALIVTNKENVVNISELVKKIKEDNDLKKFI